MRVRKRQTGRRLRAAQLWLCDGMYDRFDADGPDWPFDVLERLVGRPGRWLLCAMFGHEPVRDQCGMPEHDFCVACNCPATHLAGCAA